MCMHFSNILQTIILILGEMVYHIWYLIIAFYFKLFFKTTMFYFDFAVYKLYFSFITFNIR